MSFVGYTLNDYGRRVSEHRCDRCGNPFTVCPPLDGVEGDAKWGGCCLMERCASYDLSRDIDLIWDHVDIERGPVGSQ